jgi:hypothetical protein
MASEDVLEQICENCNERYCTIREILQKKINPKPCEHVTEDHSHCPNLSYASKKFSDRTLIQIKCIEELKWIRSQESGKEISWDEAGMLWCKEGFATKFAEVWNRGERDIYFFFRAGTVPERKKYSHPIELTEAVMEQV